ncbi:MAG: hypothetical protein KAI81_07815 [Candidatus Marinimicrobia bacterium]|nr:hypothetical protein [Candidatus Neomarinimicrobiota bacterium]
MLIISLLNRLKNSWMMIVLMLTIFLTASLSGQVEQDEYFNPLELPIPKTLNIQKINYEDENIPEKIKVDEIVKTEINGNLSIQGFRVQLISTQDISQAEVVELRAIELFENDVYLVFEYPNYKVRVGNFIDIKETGSTEIKARRNGFPRAWTVPSEINIKNRNEKF